MSSGGASDFGSLEINQVGDRTMADDIKKGRRSTDTGQRINDIENKLLTWGVSFNESLEGLTDIFESMNQALDRNTEALRKYSEDGLPELIKQYNEEKGFKATATRYGKGTLLVASVGGAIAAILFFLRNGTWPS